MRKIIIIEEDNDDNIRPYPHPIRRSPIEDGWICPICGKHVGSMEVHPCNQPWCGQTRDDGWFPGGAAWDECHPDEMPKWEEKNNGDRD